MSIQVTIKILLENYYAGHVKCVMIEGLIVVKCKVSDFLRNQYEVTEIFLQHKKACDVM